MPNNRADELLKNLLSGKFGPLPIVHEPAEDDSDDDESTETDEDR